jgi:hypothetical protein
MFSQAFRQNSVLKKTPLLYAGPSVSAAYAYSRKDEGYESALLAVKLCYYIRMSVRRVVDMTFDGLLAFTWRVFFFLHPLKLSLQAAVPTYITFQ